jgi:hypothetical protein
MDLLSIAKPRVPSAIARDTETRCRGRIERPTDVVLDLGLVALPQSDELRNRIVVGPIDPQVHDRPTHVAHDEKAGGVNRTGLAASFDTRTKSLQQARRKVASPWTSGLRLPDAGRRPRRTPRRANTDRRRPSNAATIAAGTSARASKFPAAAAFTPTADPTIPNAFAPECTTGTPSRLTTMSCR